MNTYVYVDGFNLYYGAVRHTQHKWLDIRKMCELMLKQNQIVQIKYFTARVSRRTSNSAQQRRQEVYLRALRTLDNFSIHFGHFMVHNVHRRLANPPQQGSPYVEIIKIEEKGSDVNLASHLINDGHKGLYDCAVVVSNDSDLVTPIKMVRGELGIPVGILNPHPKTAHSLQQEASFIRKIRSGVLAASQFPNSLSDHSGHISRPSAW